MARPYEKVSDHGLTVGSLFMASRATEASSSDLSLSLERGLRHMALCLGVVLLFQWKNQTKQKN